MLTPPLWTTHRLRWLPWPLESYINGVHTFGAPKGWFFPIFPWTGFAFAGLAIGFFLLTDFAKRFGALVFVALGALGGLLIVAGRWLDRSPGQFYAVYSFWTTSPEFFLIRVGMLLIILLGAYGWCRWGAAQWGWSPVIQLGQTSLLVYWVHIEFVYGRMIILPSHANSIRIATYGLLFITTFMLVLSVLRTRIREWQPVLGDLMGRWRRAVAVAVGAIRS
jgi:fucose 4-O-acetylase-like acetyltransferase